MGRGGRTCAAAPLLAQRRPQRLLERPGGREYCSRLVAAVGHAVLAAGIASAPVLLPVGGLDQLPVGLRIPVGHQVARPLPPEHRVARDPPSSALEVHLALQEVQEQGGVVEAPLLATPVRERRPEELAGLCDPEEVLLVWCLLVRVRRRDHHLVDLELVVDEVEHLAHRVRRVVCEEGRIRGHPEPLLPRCPDRRHRLVEHPLAAHGPVVPLAEPVEVDRPGEVGRGLEQVELALHLDRVGAQVDELLATNELAGDDVDLGMNQGLSTGDRDHRRAALLDRAERLVHGHPAAQHMVGVLDLAAARAGEVALVERLELDQQRELLPPAKPLAQEIGRGPNALPEGNRHLGSSSHFSSAGTPNRTFSLMPSLSLTSSGPNPSNATTSSWTIRSGAEAPAVTPTVRAPSSQAGSTSATPSTSRARQPARSATSTSRIELDEFGEPTTRIASQQAASSLIASWRFWVA